MSPYRHGAGRVIRLAADRFAATDRPAQSGAAASPQSPRSLGLHSRCMFRSMSPPGSSLRVPLAPPATGATAPHRSPSAGWLALAAGRCGCVRWLPMGRHHSPRLSRCSRISHPPLTSGSDQQREERFAEDGRFLWIQPCCCSDVRDRCDQRRVRCAPQTQRLAAFSRSSCLNPLGRPFG